MCGEVPPGFRKVPVVVHLDQDVVAVNVTLGNQMPHIQEVWLDEYSIRAPNGGGIVPDMVMLDLGDKLVQHMDGNITRRGTPLIIDNATMTHVIYDKPRMLVARGPILRNTISLRMTNFDGTAFTHASTNLFLTFVVKDGSWSAPRAIANDRFFQMGGRFQNDSEAPEPQNRLPPSNFLKDL